MLAYNSAQQLTSVTPVTGPATSFAYDGRGSRTSSTIAADGTTPALTTSYTYTASGALASVVTPTVTVGYTSDAQGLRQSRTVGATTKQFTWSSVGGLPLLLDDGDQSYIYGPSSNPIAQVDDTTDRVEYLHADKIGSTRMITDGTGATIGLTTFDEYGNRTFHSGTADSAIGFSGNWTDPRTELVYLRARDFDPRTGQFLTVDPAIDETAHPYSYADNDPLRYGDPSGLCPSAREALLGNDDDDWTSSVGKISEKLGVPESFVRDAIHKIKRKGVVPGPKKNPDVEVNTETGEVRIKGGNGDSIGNIDDTMSEILFPGSTIQPGSRTYASPKFDPASTGAAIVEGVGLVLIYLFVSVFA